MELGDRGPGLGCGVGASRQDSWSRSPNPVNGVARVPNLAQTMSGLKERGVWMIGAEGGGSGLFYEFDYRQPVAIILGHDAGADMDTDFVTAFAEGLAGHGFRVVRLEFPHMAERRQTGKRRPPDREPVCVRRGW